jgi:mono/diheme cytochrome c family protein
MKLGTTILGGAALSACLLTACGGSAAATESTTTPAASSAGGEAASGAAASPATTGGDTAATVPNDATNGASAELIAAGGERFEAVCGLCHPGGEEDSGPTLRDIHWDAARMRTQIRNGSGRMRPISAARLSDEDLDKVVAWLGTIGAVR